MPQEHAAALALVTVVISVAGRTRHRQPPPHPILFDVGSACERSGERPGDGGLTGARHTGYEHDAGAVSTDRRRHGGPRLAIDVAVPGCPMARERRPWGSVIDAHATAILAEAKRTVPSLWSHGRVELPRIERNAVQHGLEPGPRGEVVE